VYQFIHRLCPATGTTLRGSRLTAWSACYLSIQNLLASCSFRTIILPVVLCGWETWCLILREENRVRVFENRVLRGICGSKRDGVTGDWRKQRIEKLHALYFLIEDCELSTTPLRMAQGVLKHV
jgi:hypothetical protein